MALIDKSQITTPVRKRETVPFPPFGDGAEVIIQQVTFDSYMNVLGRGIAGEDDVMLFSRVLAECVLGADDKPIYTPAEWDMFGAQHLDETMKLYRKIRALSQLDVEVAAKN